MNEVDREIEYNYPTSKDKINEVRDLLRTFSKLGLLESQNISALIKGYALETVVKDKLNWGNYLYVYVCKYSGYRNM